MGLFSSLFSKHPEKEIPMTEFKPGAVFYDFENGEYHLYKVIKVAEENPEVVYTRGYWPSETKPTLENRKTFELRNACEALGIRGFQQPVFLLNEPVTSTDLEGYEDFIRIQEGLERRASQLVGLMKEADELAHQCNFEAAIHLYTEAASFSKFFFSIFDKRGYCYLKLNRYSEAIADLEHSLSIYADGLKTLYDCATAYYHAGNYPKAIERLEQLLKLDPEYEDVKTFLEMVKAK
jgi:tetratricopeptide (TPR) repeat protein